jgi:hypothetical protein
MAIWDTFDKAEESVSRESITFKGKPAFLYELKLSNAEPVLRQCLDFIVQDSKKTDAFFMIFNAKHSKGKTVNVMALRKIMADYQDLLFSAKLLRFAIAVKSFILQRQVIDLFDALFDSAKMSRTKYNYFSEQKSRDEMQKWLIAP